MIAYLETSAFLKLVVAEAESNALRTRFVALRAQGGRVVSCRLLVTEAHRAAERIPALRHALVTRALAQVEIIDLERERFTEAGLFPGAGLRSLDALHLASALDLGCDLMIAYDERVLAAAGMQGLACESPS